MAATRGRASSTPCLVVHEPSKDGSLAAAGPLMFKLDFQFNPKELQLAK